MSIRRCLFEVAAAWVTSRVSAKEAKDKQSNEKGDREVDNDFERDHFLYFPSEHLDIL